jgi:hypothetical protein
MKPAIAAKLCKVIGHPGLRSLARTVRDSGRDNALLFWTCPRCGVEIISIEVNQPQRHAHAHRTA